MMLHDFGDQVRKGKDAFALFSGTLGFGALNWEEVLFSCGCHAVRKPSGMERPRGGVEGNSLS